uniref:C2H2-type domain-containing protein n=1 Tax=Scylla olivacea TaxID=85551 RepID=A0A0P4WBM6_SCYOL
MDLVNCAAVANIIVGDDFAKGGREARWPLSYWTAALTQVLVSFQSVGRRSSGSGGGENIRRGALGGPASGTSSTVEVDTIVRGSRDTGASDGGGESGRRKWKYECIYCNKSFPTRWGLDRHTRTHTGEKPYTCNICHRNFNEQSNYQRHFRRHFLDK